jgi:phosphomannomutase
MRASNTQPAIVARFEAKSAGRLAEIQQEVGAWLATQGVSIPGASAH